ncbi:MAG: hypothetical protein RRZ68_07370, partial [Oscillospiraceae bacterium]
YKAFKKGLICEPRSGNKKQYAENTTFEEYNANICKSGMHFCKEPLEVLEYYPLVDENGEITDFAEVEALDDCKTDDNKKYCTKKLHIGAKISFADLVNASINFDYGKTDIKDTKLNDNGGDGAQIGSSGDGAKIGSSGYNAKIGSSGYNAQIGSSGDRAKIGSSGYGAKIGSSGDCAQIGSSGDYAKINSNGKYAVICCAGKNSIAKGKKGNFITLSEWGFDKGENCYIPLNVKTRKIDGKNIKEDTYYKLIDNKFVEVTK